MNPLQCQVNRLHCFSLPNPNFTLHILENEGKYCMMYRENCVGKDREMDSENRTVTFTMIMEPQQANFFGNIHGGEIMRLMDTTAGCTAIRYAKHNCVTARVDELQFLKPVHVGDFVTCTGVVVYTGTTSLEVRVTVDTEDIRDSSSKGRALQAFFTLVALGDDERPTRVPPYEPETPREKELYEHVRQRREFDRQRREAAMRRAETKD